jgi:hypothetical protein
MRKQNTVIYLPGGLDATGRWSAVANALKAVAIDDIRPCPVPPLPLRKRPVEPMPFLISRTEV